jgi:hypothetical protein
MPPNDSSQNPVHIFVSYSHRDAQYIQDDSLLGFLKGLEREGAMFWDDRQTLEVQKNGNSIPGWTAVNLSRQGIKPWKNIVKIFDLKKRLFLAILQQIRQLLTPRFT